MNCTEVQLRLNDYIDNDLPSSERQEIDRHLEHCFDCSRELGSFRLLQAEAAALPKEISPSRDLWAGIEDRISDKAVRRKWRFLLRHRKDGAWSGNRESISLGPVPQTSRRFAWIKVLVPVAAALVVAIVVFILSTRERTTSWKVSRLEGAPKVGSNLVKEFSELKIGDWLETDETSRARIDVGLIGRVEVQPNTRLRLVQAKLTDHRLALDRGTIRASIWAPPRLFFVETPSATAIDLGCEYVLHVDDNGAGVLQVTSGWVSLESHGRESIIPAGAMCLTRPGLGPGTPFLEDASEKFRKALMKYDFENGGSDALNTILTESRNMDSITLWHLFFRVEATNKGRVYDRLASLVPPPDGVTREGMLRGDAEMIKAWQKHLNLGMKPWWKFWQ